MATPGGGRRADQGRGVVEFALDQDMFWSSPANLVAHVRRVVTAPDYQPPLLPAVALELVQLSSDPTTPMSKVRALVESDPFIAAKVLRLAQSAMYTRGAPVGSLDEAMARLGLRTLSDLFLQAAMTARVFRCKGYEEPMEALRKHSVVCAHLARSVCRITGFPDEYAYMCGLLHDVGIAAGILVLGEVRRDAKPPAYDDIRASIEVVHEHASAALGKAWELPVDVQLVLRHHHHFEIQGRVHPLAAAVCLADWIAAEVKVAAGGEVKLADGRRAVQELRLSERDVKALLREAETLASAI
jgi:HD-like signal output (HDOD) protein